MAGYSADRLIARPIALHHEVLRDARLSNQVVQDFAGRRQPAGVPENDDIDLPDVVGECDALRQAHRLTPIGLEYVALIHSDISK